MNSRTTTIAMFGLLVLAGPAFAGAFHPRPLGLYSTRQVPLLAQPETVADLTLPTAAAATPPAEDERVQALREAGLDAGQIEEVAQIRRARLEEVARRAAVDDKERVARKDRAAGKAKARRVSK